VASLPLYADMCLEKLDLKIGEILHTTHRKAPAACFLLQRPPQKRGENKPGTEGATLQRLKIHP
jgi:hypothetical protein